MTGVFSKTRYRPAVRNHLKEAARLGWGGAKANLIPAIALWIVGIALVLAYYQLPPVTRALDHVGRFKLAWTPWFAIVSTALFGSLIPVFIQRTLAPKGPSQPGHKIILLMIFWAIMGWEIDLLYRLQAHFFGNGTDPITIAKKTFVDQFIWGPFLGIPQTILGYLFVENSGSITACRAALKRKSFLQRTIPLLIATWVVWVPAISLVYLFPTSLQLPLMNIILALWSLVLIFFSKNAD